MSRQRKRLLLSLFIALIPFASACSMGEHKKVAERAVERFHAQLNAEQYHDIYTQAAEEFRNGSSDEDLTKLLSAIHRKLGNVTASNQVGWRVNYTPAGTIVAVGCNTEFTEGKATEDFSWRVSGNNAVLVGYNVNSPTLITK